MKRLALIALVTVAGSAAVGHLPLRAAEARYQTDFQKAAPGQVPDDLLVLDGQFAVQQDGNQKFLELAGAPLDTFGVLFGPNATNNIQVRARIFGTGRGRRYPTFALSVGGVGGYRLQVAPAKKSVELLKGDAVLATSSYEWASGTWTQLRLQVRKTSEKGWRIEGKVWNSQQAEPTDWTITLDQDQAPVAGRPGIWGSPFAGTPIRYDDLEVTQPQP